MVSKKGARTYAQGGGWLQLFCNSEKCRIVDKRKHRNAGNVPLLRDDPFQESIFRDIVWCEYRTPPAVQHFGRCRWSRATTKTGLWGFRGQVQRFVRPFTIYRAPCVAGHHLNVQYVALTTVQNSLGSLPKPNSDQFLPHVCAISTYCTCVSASVFLSTLSWEAEVDCGRNWYWCPKQICIQLATGSHRRKQTGLEAGSYSGKDSQGVNWTLDCPSYPNNTWSVLDAFHLQRFVLFLQSIAGRWSGIFCPSVCTDYLYSLSYWLETACFSPPVT